jgi:hypothetical protein
MRTVSNARHGRDAMPLYTSHPRARRPWRSRTWAGRPCHSEPRPAHRGVAPESVLLVRSGTGVPPVGWTWHGRPAHVPAALRAVHGRDAHATSYVGANSEMHPQVFGCLTSTAKKPRLSLGPRASGPHVPGCGRDARGPRFLPVGAKTCFGVGAASLRSSSARSSLLATRCFRT